MFQILTNIKFKDLTKHNFKITFFIKNNLENVLVSTEQTISGGSIQFYVDTQQAIFKQIYYYIY